MTTAPPAAARDHLPPLVTHLLRPEAYPHRPDEVEFKQTHISYIFLAGDYVYKLKKPVTFSFLDYSTLQKCAHFCQEEIRLNRRLAPAVYLGVMPIIDQRGGFVVAENTDISGRWVTHEYAVKMRRLAEDRMLDQQLKTGQVETAQIRAIARKLAAFHRTAAANRPWPICLPNGLAFGGSTLTPSGKHWRAFPQPLEPQWRKKYIYSTIYSAYLSDSADRSGKPDRSEPRRYHRRHLH